MTESFLVQFEHYHPTVRQVSIYTKSSCDDEKLFKTIQQYEEQYKINLETVCVFQKQAVSAIQDSRIHHKVRNLTMELNGGDLINILSYKEDISQDIELHRRVIAEVATCYQPNNPEMRSRYQYHFGHLVSILFNEFFSSNGSTEETIYIGPLRAGAFVCKVGLTGTSSEVIYVHTKRVYFDTNSVAVAIGKIDETTFLGKQKLVHDGGNPHPVRGLRRTTVRREF